MMRSIFGSTLAVATFAAVADSPSDSLAARYDRAAATPEGAAYEKVVGRTVAENWASIEKCFARRHTTLHITVLFEISPDGVVGASDASPPGSEGNCALMHLRQIKFPGAPPDFVGKFDVVLKGT